MSSPHGIKKMAVHRPFYNLSPDIFGVMINCLDDKDVLLSCIRVNKRFELLIRQLYIIRERIYDFRVKKFSHAYNIQVKTIPYDIFHGEIVRHVVLSTLTKCKRTIYLDDMFKSLSDIDFKGIKLDTYTTKDNFDCNCRSLHVRSVNPCKFPNVETLDLFLIPPYHHDEKDVDLEKYSFNPQIRKLLITYDRTDGNVYYAPEGTIKRFQYNLFMQNYLMLTECILLFNTHMAHIINVPERIVRFGISSPTCSRNKGSHTINLSEASNLRELIIWDNSDIDTRVEISATPSKTLQKLTIKAPRSLTLKGFDEFKYIDELLFIVDNAQHSGTDRFKQVIDWLLKSPVEIRCVSFVGFGVYSIWKWDGFDLVTAQMKPTVKSLKFYRCHLHTVNIKGEGLTDISFLKTSRHPKLFDWGDVILPENVATVTCQMEQADKFIETWGLYNRKKKYPVGLKHLRLCHVKPELQEKWVTDERQYTNIGDRLITFVDEPLLDEEVRVN